MNNSFTIQIQIRNLTSGSVWK
uniref:Uncharacterized protein n=1 Tax=Arundo donax TaxID=35708 RepID=A0A0A9AEI6_ARUDO